MSYRLSFFKPLGGLFILSMFGGGGVGGLNYFTKIGHHTAFSNNQISILQKELEHKVENAQAHDIRGLATKDQN